MPAAYADHARLMFDLQVLALQGDVTRVITFQLARETSTRTYPEIGVPDPHHPLTHHGGDPEKMAKVAKINAFHVSLFAYFLEKLKATPDGDGSLLDHSLYLYGSGMGNPDVHDHVNLPILVAGGAGQRKGGRHIRYAEPTPLANLHLTLLDKVGVRLDPSPTARQGEENYSSRFHSDAMVAEDDISLRLYVHLRHVPARAEGQVDAPQVDGTTPLHRAAYRDDDREAQNVLVRAGANVKAANRYGVTPLSLACTNGSGRMVELLLKAGADPNTHAARRRDGIDDSCAHRQEWTR